MGLLMPPVPTAALGEWTFHKVIQEIKCSPMQEECLRKITLRFKIASLGSKSVSFGREISQDIVRVISVFMK